MKKIIIIFACALMCLGLVGCGTNKVGECAKKIDNEYKPIYETTSKYDLETLKSITNDVNNDIKEFAAYAKVKGEEIANSTGSSASSLEESLPNMEAILNEIISENDKLNKRIIEATKAYSYKLSGQDEFKNDLEAAGDFADSFMETYEDALIKIVTKETFDFVINSYYELIEAIFSMDAITIDQYSDMHTEVYDVFSKKAEEWYDMVYDFGSEWYDKFYDVTSLVVEGDYTEEQITEIFEKVEENKESE